MTASSPWRRNRLLVLCYHGVSLSDEHEWAPGLYLSPELFESRLQALASGGWKVLPLDEAVKRLNSGGLPAKSVVITFDDGFADFRLAALPLLRKYGFPATVYLTTWYVFNNRPIFNLIVPYLLWRKREAAPGPVQRFGWHQAPDLTTPEGRLQAWMAIRDSARANNLSGAGEAELAMDVAETLGVDYEALRTSRILTLMTPEECSEVARGDATLEMHTHRHRIPEDAGLFARELEENSARIRELSGVEPRHFCYPSGVYRPEMLPVLRNAKVLSATTCEPGMVASSTDPLLMPRLLDMQHLPELTFSAWLSGVADLLPRRTQSYSYEPQLLS